MSDVDLSQISDKDLAEEVVNRFRVFDETNIANYRDKEIIAFVTCIADAFSESLSNMDKLISEFSNQREDLEHQLSFGAIEGTLSPEKQENLMRNITDAIVLRRLVKDARSLTQGFRDMIRSVETRIKKYQQLDYQGKSAVFGDVTDGIRIDTTLRKQNTSYQSRIATKFIQANHALKEKQKNDGSTIQVDTNGNTVIDLLKRASGQS